MNHKQRIICQALVLWLLGVTIIAISDQSDKKNYENKEVNNAKIVASADEYVQEPIIIKSQSERVLKFKLERTDDCQPRVDYIEEVVCKEPDNEQCQYEQFGQEQYDDYYSYESLEIPYGSTDSYMFLDYRTLTDTSSKQYELQQYAYNGDYGIREVDGYYCVAVSNMYGNVGDKIKVTTDRGNSYWCIIADIKGYDAIDGWYHVNSQGTINLIEFVVNGDLIPNDCWQMGDMGVLENIGGNVVKIERLP